MAIAMEAMIVMQTVSKTYWDDCSKDKEDDNDDNDDNDNNEDAKDDLSRDTFAVGLTLLWTGKE